MLVTKRAYPSYCLLAEFAVKIPEGTIINPSSTCAVVGGNVTTSQRVTDVVLRAFEACAASQGCCNNLTFGNEDFGFYETIAGGSGAGPTWNGESGVVSSSLFLPFLFPFGFRGRLAKFSPLRRLYKPFSTSVRFLS